MERNEVRITGRICEDIQLIADAAEWGRKLYETKISTARYSGVEDVLILQFPAAAVGTGKELKAIGKDTRIKLTGEIRTENEKEIVATKPSVKIFVYASSVELAEETEEDANEVILGGNICKETVPRKTPKGTNVTDMIVAAGTGKPAFVPCVCWCEAAEAAADLTKGTHVEVKGRIQSREFKKHVKGSDVPFLLTAYEVSVVEMRAEVEEAEEGDGK